ncbi:MAG: YihY/virulence factor BrkB family protein, partial [Actinomycetota bacterium]
MIKLIAQLLTLKILVTRLRSREDERRAGSRDPSRPGETSRMRRRGMSGGRVTARSTPGPEPDSPLDLEKTDWKQTSKRALKEIKDDRVTLIAAGMAYYLFLAIFPAIIAFVGMLGLFEIDTAPMVEAIRDNLPGESGDLLVGALQGSKTTRDSTALTAVLVGIGLALWSASSGFVALQKGLNVVYDVREDRKFVGARAIAFLLIIATGLLGGVSWLFFTLGNSKTFDVFDVFGWVLTIAAVVVLFSVYYYFGPRREKPTWQWVSAGGILGAFIW